MVRNPIRLFIVALATLAVAACGSSDGGMNNGGNDTPATPTPTALMIVSGNNQTGPIDSQLNEPLVVELRDKLGNPAAGKRVTFRVRKGNGSLTGGGRAVVVETDELTDVVVEPGLLERDGRVDRRAVVRQLH